MSRAPHVRRCLALLDALEAPVVQVWGWPGSGRAELLAALLERPAALALAPADLADRKRREDAASTALRAGARRLVVHGLPAAADPREVVGALAELLPADRRLVFATRRRVALPGLLAALLAPRDLALEPAEAAELLEGGGAARPGPAAVEALTAAADGWYRPLLLAASARAEGGRLPASPEALVALPAVAEFLRLEVLADLPAEERAVLARGGTPGGGPAVRRLVEEWGLLVGSGEGLRPLRLLGALAAREERPEPRRARRGPPPAPAPAPASGAAGGELPVAIPESARFRLHLLGRPEGWKREPGGSWRRLRWPLRRAVEILAYLASSPERRAARRELEEALWPEEGAGSAAKNFHPTLSHLRRGLRDGASVSAGAGAGDEAGDEAQALLLAGEVYALNPELGWWVDLDELERLAAAGNALAAQGRDAEAAAAWEAAWRLYRGGFLEGSAAPWAAARRELYRRRYLLLLQELGAAYERLDRPEAAVDAYRTVLAEDSLQERVHAALMRLYGRRSRRDLVRRQYERLTALLREELGVEPLAETTREYHRLMTERG